MGGHFQFKHEKSWDITTGPSIYDKYFDIYMENLNLALSTIPFFERNSIDMALFSETDIQSMNHRATKFKQKYYNDKNFTTPELDAQARILNSLKSENKVDIDDIKTQDNNMALDKDVNNENLKQLKEIDLEQCDQEKYENIKPIINPSPEIENKESQSSEPIIKDDLKALPQVDNSTLTAVEEQAIVEKNENSNTKVVDNDFDEIEKEILDKRKANEPEKEIIVEKSPEKVISSKKLEPQKGLFLIVLFHSLNL